MEFGLVEKVEFNNQFGKFVKSKRDERNWSQPDLAERLQNNFQNISRLERGEISPTLYWCNNLAQAFEQSLTEFISEFETTLNND